MYIMFAVIVNSVIYIFLIAYLEGRTIETACDYSIISY